MKINPKLIKVFFLFSVYLSQLAGMLEGAKNIYQPSTLQEQCCKTLADLFFQVTPLSKSEKENLKNLCSFPKPFLDHLANLCLEENFVLKFPHKVFKYDGQELSEDHRFLIRYQIFDNRKPIIGLDLPASPACIRIAVFEESNKGLFLEDQAYLLSNIAISSTGKYFSYLAKRGNDDISLIVWDVASGDIIQVKKKENLESAKLAFYKDNTIIIAVGNQAIVYDIKTNNEKLVNCSEHSKLAIAEDKFLLCGSPFSNNIMVYDLSVGFNKGILHQEHQVIALAVSKNSLVACASADGMVNLWQIKKNGKFSWNQSFKLKTVAGSIAFDPTSSFLATSSANHLIAIWDIASKQLLYKKRNPDIGKFISWSPNHRELIICNSQSDDFYSYAPKSLRLGILLKKFLKERNEIKKA